MINRNPEIGIDAAAVGQRMGVPFHEHQRQAIAADPEPGVVIAGAGSGKTEVMAARVVYLVANQIAEPDRILGLTLTNLAAGELADRIRGYLRDPRPGRPLISADQSEPSVSTYHSFADQLVRSFGLRIGVETDLINISDARRHQVCAAAVRRTQLGVAELGSAFSSVVGQVLALDDQLAQCDVSTDLARQFDERVIKLVDDAIENGSKVIAAAQTMRSTSIKRRMLLDLLDEFRALKRERGLVDFADMSRYALQIARTVPTARESVAAQFDVVLLDEYQDTNIALRHLMQTFFGNGTAITAVGDPLQCIYAFQGASATNIERFGLHFPNAAGAPASKYSLPVTLRSGKHIVAIANQLTAQLRVDSNAQPLQAVDTPAFGDGRAAIASFVSADEEADWLVAKLRAAEAEGIPLDSMALLLRGNEEIAWAFTALSQRGLPVQVRGKRQLLQVPEVAELVAMLRVIAEPAANQAFVRLLSGPRWRLSQRDLAAIGRVASQLARRTTKADPQSLSNALAAAVDSIDQVDIVAYGDAIDQINQGHPSEVSTAGRERLQTFAREIGYFRSHMQEPLADFCYRVARDSGLLVESAAQTERVQRGMHSNLRAFLKLASEFRSVESDSGLFGFLDFIADSEKYRKQPELLNPAHPGAVQLMTVHAAKGLQFRVVALPRLVEGKFPSSEGRDLWYSNPGCMPFPLRAEDQPALMADFPVAGELPGTKDFEALTAQVRAQDAADERRLIYVAVTRTRDLLLASCSRFAEGSTKPRDPSPYWEELRQAMLAEFGEQAVEQLAPPADEAVVQPPTRAAWPLQPDSAAMQRTRQLAELTLSEIAAPNPAALVGELAAWDQAIDAIELELRQRAEVERSVSLPASLTVSQLMRLGKDEVGFTLDLIRPMPAAPAPAASRGTRFHEWVERRSKRLAAAGIQLELPLPEPEFGDAEFMDPAQFEAFKLQFEASEWGERTPAHVEYPFALPIAGRVLRGRIDAIYSNLDGYAWTVIDWKTNQKTDADPLQLAVYRHALANRLGCDPSKVRAGFYYVASNETVWEQPMMSWEQLCQILNG